MEIQSTKLPYHRRLAKQMLPGVYLIVAFNLPGHYFVSTGARSADAIRLLSAVCSGVTVISMQFSLSSDFTGGRFSLLLRIFPQVLGNPYGSELRGSGGMVVVAAAV